MRQLQIALCGIAFGTIAGWIFRRLTNRARLRRASSRMVAHILEFALFVDDPRAILRAQLDLARANFELLREIALPTLIAAALFAALYTPLDGVFGREPLRVHEPAVITAHTEIAALQLIVPAGVAIESPPIRIPGAHETSWRVRPARAVEGGFYLAHDSREVRAPLDVPWPHAPWIPLFTACSAVAAFALSVFLK